ncbi:hypothetical protein PTI98_001174 [Pleurotus ostreatus]|nr:hypothetical protein PTI98_001174 [Pleurotus ostreatus]
MRSRKDRRALKYMLSRACTVVLSDFLAPGLLQRTAGSKSIFHVKRLQHGLAPLSSPERPHKPIPLTQRTPKDRDRADPSLDIFNTTTTRIHQAVQSHNIEIIWDYWQYLEQRRLLRLLGHVQLKRISTLLVDSFCPVGFPKKEWSELERTVVEKIALVAAAHKAPDALNSCMLALIQRNDPDAVLRLYERFMQLVAKSEGAEDASGDGLEEGEGSTEYDALASATYSSVDTMPYKPGRATVLLSGITACAMKDDFLGALHMCLNTVIRPQHYAITAFMNKLKGNRPLQRKVEEYVNRLRSATMVAHPTELSKRVNQLATSRSIRSIEKLYRSIMDGISGPAPCMVAHESAKAVEKPVVFTEVGWTSFMVAFLKCGRKDLAAQMWDDMIGLDVQPGVSTWTAYIDACDGISAYNEAVAGWGMMLEQGVKPEALSYRAIISTYFNARQTDKAMDAFRTFLEDAAKGSPERQQLAVYNTVLHGLLIAGRVDEATATFQKMVDEGPRPDVVSYNTFLKFWARTSNFKMLSSVMNNMVAAGIKGDVFSFSTILSALLKVGRDDAPELMIALMRKQGVEPNVAIYSAIMDQQLREQTVEALHTAMRLLQRMELDPTSQPNEVTYTSFLAGIYRGSWLPPAVAEDWRRNIVDRMKRRGIKLNRVTYHILLKACLEYPEPEGVETAMVYYREMVKQKIHIISITWYILLSGLLRRGELVAANEILADMARSGVQPTGAVAELVYKARKRVGRRAIA